VINPKAWDELPDDLKAMVEEGAKIATLESWTKLGALDMGAMETFKKRGNIIIELAPEVQAAAYKLGKEWADAQAAKDPWFKKFLDSQRKFDERWKTVERNRILTYA
jgi:TRAP-type mannitol/chloroaromatic compound transport system substrate-binding protein